MEGRSLKFLYGDLSFFMLIAFYECSLWTVVFFSRRKTHATYTSCTHRLCQLGCLSPTMGGRLQGSLFDWSRSWSTCCWPTALSRKLVEGLEEMHGGENGEELSSPSFSITSTVVSIKPNLLFQNNFVCRIQNTDSTGKRESPERLCWL